MSQPQEIKRPDEKASSAEDEIRVRAYELYQQRGGEEDHAIEDWLRAEEEISQNTSNRKAAQVHPLLKSQCPLLPCHASVFVLTHQDAQQSFQDAQSAATDVYKTTTDLFRKGMEYNIEVQKHLLELASQQNADTVDLWRATFRNFPGAEPMFNLAEQTVENFIGMHRRTLEIMEGQTKETAESAKTQGERTARAAHEMTDSATTQQELMKTA